MKKFLTSLLFSFCFLMLSQAQIMITEIMYNPPESGTDSLEYIEIYNPGLIQADITGYTFTGFIDTLPNMQLFEGQRLVLSVNAEALMNTLGIESRQWMSGGLSNSGELIEVKDAAGNVIDAVTYDDAGDWPVEPDGDGYSIELCDVNTDNSLGTNWAKAGTGTGVMINGAEIFASPGADNTASCDGPPGDHFVTSQGFSFTPQDITIMVGETVQWDNVEGDHNVNGSQDIYPSNLEGFFSGAPSEDAWTFSHTFNTVGVYDYRCDLHFEGGMVGTVTVINPPAPEYTPYPIGQVSSVDADGIADSLDVKVELEGVVYGVNLLGGSLSFTMIDDSNDGINVFNFGNDYAYVVTEGDHITVQGQIDMFNGLLEIIADTVIMNSANNALFDPTLVTVLDESTESQLVRLNDVTLMDASQWAGDGSSFNVTVTDGTNEYALRIDNETTLSTEPAPEGEFDVIGIGGQFDNSAPHDSGYQLFPRYIPDIIPDMLDVVDDNVLTTMNTNVEIDVLANDNIPNTIVNLGVSADPTIGTVNVNIIAMTVTYSPNMDECGTDSFDYFICDADGCDTATVNINVICTDMYPLYPIATVSSVDADGTVDSTGVTCEIRGIVYGVDLRENGLQFTIIDESDPNAGIGLFSGSEDFGYAVNEGDMISVTGTIGAFNGFAQISPDNVFLLSPGNALHASEAVTELSEATESKLVTLEGVSFVDDSQWTGAGSGFNMDVTDGTNTYTVRIDDEVDLYSMPLPTGSLFNITGLGGQFDSSSPFDSGYQLFPRYTADIVEIVIEELTVVDDNVSTEINTAVEIDPTANDIIPNPVTIFGILDNPSFGTLAIDFTDTTIVYTPNVDECGLDQFEYFICDASLCDTATISIDVTCPPSYPLYPIATVTTLDAQGAVDSLDVACEIRGIVYGVNLRAGGAQFTIIDETDPDAGISLFSFDDDFGYTVTEGDMVSVVGTIDQFNGLTQISPDNISLMSSGNGLHAAEIVGGLSEATESKLVTLEGVSFVDGSQWTGTGSGFNVDVTDGTNTYTIRIDDEVDLYSMPLPMGTVFEITGLGGQFDNESPFDSGYQLLPRYTADIAPLIDATNDLSLAQEIHFYPNPVNNLLNIESETTLESIQVTNLLGQVLMTINKPQMSEEINVSTLTTGMYILTFKGQDRMWSAQFVKE